MQKNKKSTDKDSSASPEDQNQTINLGVEYLQERGVLRETFEAYGGEITGVDRDLIQVRLNQDLNARKTQHWGQVALILWFPVFGPDGSTEAKSWIARRIGYDAETEPTPKFVVPWGERSPLWIPRILTGTFRDASVRSQAISGNGRHDNRGRGEKVSDRKVNEIGVRGLRAVA